MGAKNLLKFDFQKPVLSEAEQAVRTRRQQIEEQIAACRSRFASIEYLLNSTKYADALVLCRLLSSDLIQAFASIYLEDEPEPQVAKVLQAIPQKNIRTLLEKSREWLLSDDATSQAQADLRDTAKDLKKALAALNKTFVELKQTVLANPLDDYRTRVSRQLFGAGAVVVLGVIAVVVSRTIGTKPTAVVAPEDPPTAVAAQTLPKGAQARFDALFKQAAQLAKRRAHGRAVRLYQEALKLQPNGPRTSDAYNNLGWSLAQLGRYPEASQAYQSAIKAKPNHKRAKQNLEALQRQLQRKADFKKLYREAFALAQRGNHEQAVVSYHRAIKKQPNDSDASNAYNDLGWSLYQLTQYRKAIKAFEAAIKKKPNNQRAKRNLKLAQEKANAQPETTDGAATGAPPKKRP